MRKLNKNNGITLIALIITIIVMLILVSVSISMAVNGGLFNYAGKAVGDTENEINKEGKLGEGTGIQVGDTWYADIDSYTKGIGYKWITIYEGNTPTEEGQILLSAKFLFSEGTRYRITIEGIGEIETTAILMQEEEGGEMYYLFAIDEEEIITWNTEEEMQEKLDLIEDSSNKILALALNVSNSSYLGSGIAFQGAETEYTITKIEKYGKTLDIAYWQTQGEDLWESLVTFNISVETEPLTIEQKRNLVAYMYDCDSFEEVLKILNGRK